MVVVPAALACSALVVPASAVVVVVVEMFASSCPAPAKPRAPTRVLVPAMFAAAWVIMFPSALVVLPPAMVVAIESMNPGDAVVVLPALVLAWSVDSMIVLAAVVVDVCTSAAALTSLESPAAWVLLPDIVADILVTVCASAEIVEVPLRLVAAWLVCPAAAVTVLLVASLAASWLVINVSAVTVLLVFMLVPNSRAPPGLLLLASSTWYASMVA